MLVGTTKCFKFALLVGTTKCFKFALPWFPASGAPGRQDLLFPGVRDGAFVRGRGCKVISFALGVARRPAGSRPQVSAHDPLINKG